MSSNSNKIPTGLNNILGIAKTALLTQQSAMSVVSNNIANVETEGYHRQTVNLITANSIGGRAGTWGQGVSVESVERAYNSFYTRQERSEVGFVGQYLAEYEYYSRAEELLGEISDYGIGSSMSDFWNSWEDLANDVDSETARINVIGAAQDLGTSMANTYEDLDSLREEMNVEIAAQAGVINSYASQIAELNEKIYTVTSKSQNANDLMDNRDLLIKELGEMANITIEEESNGSMSVYLGSETLVYRNEYRTVEWETDTSGEHGKAGGNLIWADEGREVQLYSGSLFGATEVRDYVTGVLENLDTLADTLRDRINVLHLDGIGSDGTTGNYFWEPTGSGALSLTVNASLVDNPEKVAASTVSPTGDSSLANQMFNVQFEETFNDGTSDFSDYWEQIVTDVGIQVSNANTSYQAAEASLQQTESWQQSYTGVSLDEEMVDLISVQYAFSAASRIFTVADELFATLLSAF